MNKLLARPLLLLIVGAIAFSTMQAFGPRVAIPKTDLTVNAPDAGSAKINDHSPGKLTDDERLEQQRALERETEGRVDLPEQ